MATHIGQDHIWPSNVMKSGGFSYLGRSRWNWRIRGACDQQLVQQPLGIRRAIKEIWPKFISAWNWC